MKRAIIVLAFAVAACGGTTVSPATGQPSTAVAEPTARAELTQRPQLTAKPRDWTLELANAGGNCDQIDQLASDFVDAAPTDQQAAASAIQAAMLVCHPELAPTPVPIERKPVVVKGTGGKRNTKPFDLQAGDWTVVISGKSTDTYDNVIVHLVERGGDYSEGLVNEIKDGRGSYKYETILYELDTAQYYLEVDMPSGTWNVTFTPFS